MKVNNIWKGIAILSICAMNIGVSMNVTRDSICFTVFFSMFMVFAICGSD